MAQSELLEVTSLAGKLLLESGAEITRVEQTAVRLSCALGAKDCEAYATPTTIVLSVTMPTGDVQSIVRRITRRETRLDRVEAINSLSREAESKALDTAEAKRRLCEIQKAHSYSPLLLMLASGFGAGAFAVFFGGSLLSFACGFAGGVGLRALLQLLARLQPNLFVNNLVAGLVASLFGFICAKIGFTDTWQEVTIAVLMLMVPGVAITNALRDIAAGELVAGISRLTEAFCIAAALSCGTAAVFAAVQLLGGTVL